MRVSRDDQAGRRGRIAVRWEVRPRFAFPAWDHEPETETLVWPDALYDAFYAMPRMDGGSLSSEEWSRYEHGDLEEMPREVLLRERSRLRLRLDVDDDPSDWMVERWRRLDSAIAASLAVPAPDARQQRPSSPPRQLPAWRRPVTAAPR